jgi:uncharacterized protein
LPEVYLIFLIISILSVVQSIFGIGILVFGTPTLLILGLNFSSVLSFLLPASFAISFLQVVAPGHIRPSISTNLYFICLPAIAIGLLLADQIFLSPWFKIAVGFALLASALTRISPHFQLLLMAQLRIHTKGYHLLMGIVHGLTNLGGALLTILASSVHSEKHAIRYMVAHYYLAFSLVQMLMVSLIIGEYETLFTNSYTAVISTVIYVSVGRVAFSYASPPIFSMAITVFMCAYGAIMLVGGISSFLTGGTS